MTGRGGTNSGERLLILAAVAVLVGGSAYDFYGFSSQTLTTITTTTAAVNTSTTTVNGISYYADNVTSLMIAEDMGTFHFNNGSVTFLGVEFQTICTGYGSACPGVPAPPPGTTITVQSGPGITLNVTFPDHSSETISGGFPIGGFEALSHHTNPQAGILIVYTNSSPFYKSYLLVSTIETSASLGSAAGIPSNTIVATVTVTETLTIQASQATTTYAIPTTNCTLLGGGIVTPTTTTITVGYTSTTTATVTTTSTSYTQTVTVTSCTYSKTTVTSTSTTTTTVTP